MKVFNSSSRILPQYFPTFIVWTWWVNEGRGFLWRWKPTQSVICKVCMPRSWPDPWACPTRLLTVEDTQRPRLARRSNTRQTTLGISRWAQEDRQVHRGRQPQCLICKLSKVDRKEESRSTVNWLNLHLGSLSFFQLSCTGKDIKNTHTQTKFQHFTKWL
jgi:hypothetical protein